MSQGTDTVRDGREIFFLKTSLCFTQVSEASLFQDEVSVTSLYELFVLFSLRIFLKISTLLGLQHVGSGFPHVSFQVGGASIPPMTAWLISQNSQRGPVLRGGLPTQGLWDPGRSSQSLWTSTVSILTAHVRVLQKPRATRPFPLRCST